MVESIVWNFLLQFFILRRATLSLGLLWSPSAHVLMMTYLRYTWANLGIIRNCKSATWSFRLLLILMNKHLLRITLVTMRSSLKLLLELVKLIELLLSGETAHWFWSYGLSLTCLFGLVGTNTKNHTRRLTILLIVQVLLNVIEISSWLRKLLMMWGMSLLSFLNSTWSLLTRCRSRYLFLILIDQDSE